MLKIPMKIFLFLLALVCVACGHDSPSSSYHQLHTWMENNGKIKVLCTTAMIADIVKQVGGEHIDVLTLIDGELNPHSYQLVKGDDEKLSFAQIIFANGLGLEHGPSLQYYLEQSSKAIALGNEIAKNDPGRILNIHGQLDPHIWMDVSLWNECVGIVVATLEKKDPAHAAVYEENGKKLQNDLQHLHKQIITLLHEVPSPQRYLVTSHDAFNYFAKAYLTDNDKESWEERFHAPEGLAPESQLSTSDIQRTIDFLYKHQVRVVFPESNVSKDSIRKIVNAGNEKGMDLIIAEDPLYGDAMGSSQSNADTYTKMLLHDAKTIVYYLKNQPLKRQGT